jgi:tetratricopeptide (TPR) repeat protein
MRACVLALLLRAVVAAQGLGPADDTAIRSLLKDGDAAYRKGDFETSRQSFEKALDKTKATARNSPLRYDALKRLSSARAAAGEFADAERYLEQAIAWRESVLGPTDPKLADDLSISVNLLLGLKNFDRALEILSRVQTLHVTAFGAESIPVADDFLRTAQIYLAQKKPKDALRPLSRARELRMNIAGPLDPGLLPVLDRLSDTLNSVAGASEATESCYRQALLIREALYGKDSPELISTVEALANTYAVQAEYVAAEPLYFRLLSLWEGMVGKDHPMIAVTLDKLVVFYAKQARTKEAREALARSVSIRARFLAVGLSHQAADAASDARGAEARALYQRAAAALDRSDPANRDLLDQLQQAIDGLDAKF